MNRSNDNKQLCSYIHRICLQNKLDGFDYCIRHILVDKNAPFKQCSFVHPSSSKRCPNAARKTDRKDSALCPWHIKKLYLKNKQSQLQNQVGLEGTRNKEPNIMGLMEELEHYCPSEDHEKERKNVDWVKQEDESITASDRLRHQISVAAVEMNDESDEDISNPSMEEIIRSDVIDSDSENMDSDQDDPLRHAGVYTAEEVSLILRDKMLKLQSLYIGQFKHLQYLFKEKYKKYLNSLQTEREMQSLEPQFRPFPLCSSDSVKLKALKKYHKYHSQEALLKSKLREKKRAVQEGDNYLPKSYSKCIFNKDEPCQNRTIPLSHYCRTHILYDVNQVLFRPCASGDPPCLNPIISIRRHNTCIYHKDLKPTATEVDRLNQEADSADCGQDLNQFNNTEEMSSLELANVPGPFFPLEGFSSFGSTQI